mgnify:CR=1 FL=1
MIHASKKNQSQKKQRTPFEACAINGVLGSIVKDDERLKEKVTTSNENVAADAVVEVEKVVQEDKAAEAENPK